MSEWVSAGKVRMTPKGTYDSTVAYEILDVVSNSDKSSFYMAKQAVPINTALTNTSYWECILDSNNIEELIAPTYEDLVYPLSKGQYCTYNDELYIANQDLESIESWTASHWTKTTIGDEFSTLKGMVGLEKITGWINDYYISLTGDVANVNEPMRNTSWRCIYIACSPGDVFTISGDGAAPRLWGFTDNNYTIITKADANTVADNLTLTAPENAAYLILNDRAKTSDSYRGILVQPALTSSFAPTNNALSDCDYAVDNKMYVIASTSNVQNLPSTTYPGLLITFSNDVGKLQLYLQSSGTLYYRRHWAVSWQAWRQFATTDQIDEAVNQPYDNILSAFNNITCIGDSLTYSLVYTGRDADNDRDLSRQAFVTYPMALQRKSGAECTSLAKAGATSITWFDEFNESIATKTNQLAIVYLGTNSGLTDTIDEDMQGDDYTQWENTLTGCYGKIIAKLLSVGSKIVLVKVYSSSGDLETTNAVIESMATKFNVPVIDNTRFIDMKYHSWPDGSGYNYIHYNDLGYSKFADYVAYQISNLGTDDMKKIIPE